MSALNIIVENFLTHTKKTLFLKNNFWRDHSEKNLIIKGKGLFDSSIFSKRDTFHFFDYFQKTIDTKYDFIVAELPFGLNRKKESNFAFSIPENWEMIYDLLKKLKKNGHLIVSCESRLGVSEQGKKFLQTLKENGVFLSALFESPENILAPLTSVQPHIAIFSTQHTKGDIFVASLCNEPDGSVIFENFINKTKGQNLSQGDLVKLEDFKGFFNYRVNRKIEKLETQYKEFERKLLKDISMEINTTKDIFEAVSGEFLYVPLIGNLKVYSDLKILDKNHQNFYQIKIDTSLVSAKYLAEYLNSDLGQLSLKALRTDSFIPKINKRDLSNLLVSLPPLTTQKEIVGSYGLLEKTYDVIDSLRQELSLSPKNAKVINEKLTGTLKVLKKLSKSDRVLHYLSQGEGGRIEYKQTFSKDLKSGTKERYIEDSSIKNIVGFLNKKGGSLLIGITDESDIYGIENDFYQTDDKYLLHFKNKIKTAVGEEFFDLIDYEIIEVNGSKVLLVECQESPIPVYMYGKDFYVRTNPATDKLEGPTLVQYIKNHFNH